MSLRSIAANLAKLVRIFTSLGDVITPPTFEKKSGQEWFDVKGHQSYVFIGQENTCARCEAHGR